MDATFRFYGELNDLLPRERRQRAFAYHFTGTPAVKDAIEALGVPHTEVDVILVGERSVDFGYHLQRGDRVAVYPVFETFDVTPLVRLRPEPMRRTAFIADTHLGRLARRLRLLGFDTRYAREADDDEIIEHAVSEHRIILTRDRGLLKNGRVTHGYCVRSTVPAEQVVEVIERLHLVNRIRPFTRCLECNGAIARVPKSRVRDELPRAVETAFEEFYRCGDCRRVYWKGSHYDRLESWVAQIMGHQE